MGQVQNNIFGFKSEARDYFEKMVLKEETLCREIQVQTTRVDAYEREKASRIDRIRTINDLNSNKSVVNRLTDTSRPEAVQKFQNFIAKRGTTDGWNSVDHNNFARIWSRNCNSANDILDEENFLNLVETDLTGRTTQDILNHVKFYRTYLKLKSNQQREIKAWKLARQANELSKSVEIEQKAKTLKTPRTISKREKMEKEKRIQELEKWKLEKEMKKQKENENLAKIVAQDRRRQKEEAEARQRILKLREIERKHRKEAEIIIKNSENKEKEVIRKQHAIQVNKQIRQMTNNDIYQRQLLVNERKLEERENKIAEEIEKLKRKQKLDSLAQFDPERVYKRNLLF
jgi:hypothetical protein